MGKKYGNNVLFSPNIGGGYNPAISNVAITEWASVTYTYATICDPSTHRIATWGSHPGSGDGSSIVSGKVIQNSFPVSGKFYLEVQYTGFNTATPNDVLIGTVILSGLNPSEILSNNPIPGPALSMNDSGFNYVNPSAAPISYGQLLVSPFSGIISMYFDVVAKTIGYMINGVDLGIVPGGVIADPLTPGNCFTIYVGNDMSGAGNLCSDNLNKVTAKFKASEFTYAPPVGYTAWL